MEKIQVNEKGEPILPEGWTYLIHGTNISQWNKDMLNSDSFIVQNKMESGLYCVEMNQAIENQKNGSNVSELHSKLKEDGNNKNIEIRCLIYKDLRRNADKEKVKGKLTEEEINDINRYHIKRPYYPAIPNHTKLIKIMTTKFDNITKKDKEILWYVPEDYLEHYIQDSQRMLKREKVISVQDLRKNRSNYENNNKDDYSR